MLPRQYRLVDPTDFAWTLRRGCRVANRFMAVTIAAPSKEAAISRPLEELSGGKLGLIVAKRELPRAVDRNLLKRRLREIMRPKMASYSPGTTVVIRVFAASLTLPFNELEDQLQGLLLRAQNKLVVREGAEVSGD